MSNITEHNTQILQAALNTQFIDACINFASLSFYLFDFCLTFDLQIDFMWGRKWSITTLLFLLLHFSVVLSQISDAAGPFLSCKSGFAFDFVSLGVALIFNVVTAAIAALRIFAINGKHWLLPTIIVILSLPQVIANIYEIINTHIMFFSQNICAPAYSNAWTMVELDYAAVATALAAHIVVVGAIWYHTFTLKKLAHNAGTQVNLVTLLLRDGTIYFGALLALDILETIARYSPSFPNIGVFVGSATGVILSRFFLNLRSTADLPQGTASTSEEIMSELRFSPQNTLGGSVHFGSIAEDVGDEEDGVEEASEVWTTEGNVRGSFTAGTESP